MGNVFIDVVFELLGVASQGLKIRIGEPRVEMLASSRKKPPPLFGATCEQFITQVPLVQECLVKRLAFAAVFISSINFASDMTPLDMSAKRRIPMAWVTT